MQKGAFVLLQATRGIAALLPNKRVGCQKPVVRTSLPNKVPKRTPKKGPLGWGSFYKNKETSYIERCICALASDSGDSSFTLEQTRWLLEASYTNQPAQQGPKTNPDKGRGKVAANYFSTRLIIIQRLRTLWAQPCKQNSGWRFGEKQNKIDDGDSPKSKIRFAMATHGKTTTNLDKKCAHTKLGVQRNPYYRSPIQYIS